MAVSPLVWSDWFETQVYQSHNSLLRMAEATTPIGTYMLGRRYAWGGSRIVHGDKWFVECPSARTLGPFDDDVTAKREAQEFHRRRVEASLEGSDMNEWFIKEGWVLVKQENQPRLSDGYISAVKVGKVPGEWYVKYAY